jgi:plastocyanin
MRRSFCALAALPLVVACSAPAEPPPAESATASAPPAAATLPAQSSVVGKVPTANGQPAVVVLEPQTPREVPQDERPVMDQVALQFIPGVLVVRTGHPVEFRNSDDVLHNVRVNEDETKAGTFNVAIPMGEDYRFTFDRDGFYNVGCDIHPAMAATIYSSPSPYATLSDPSGNFEIPFVPPGGYKAVVFSGADRIERKVEVLAGRTELNLTP